MSRPLRIALVAGELSGDLLGGALVRALRERLPQAQCYGVVGPRMREAGCAELASIEMLSVMGIAEVLHALPRILRLRKQLFQEFSRNPPDLLIGIDAPDFNLPLERKLRARGVKTVHVVSPTVWAWRAGRVHGIDRAVERILCLFPFEPAFYEQQGVKDKALYIGHPLAEELDDRTTPAQARAALGLAEQGPVLAILPGSRGSELKYLGLPFAQAATLLAQRIPGLRIITPVAKPSLRAGLQALIAQQAPGLDWTLLDGKSREAMRAADVVMLASGTATLECLLLGRPMVVGYRGAWFTELLLLKLGMLKTRYVSLPNLLSDEPVVPELLQHDCTPEHLAREVQALFGSAARQRQLAQFDAVRARLRCNAAQRAAELLAPLL
ncbi:lipid-A-disaccharide synthase [Solimonas aquatica]|uniref:Lipid-A-disaccharide synthase n=1 Tax=Solimonas aquatica TaxID=489703 RepID=A0A1H9AJ86_9GAMM|nr:lipid-A-disaccharide synthase [Solimonas aquatica]SEP76719.1 lipid-A-disaccharide synthase [Solimonas aquatica]